MFENIKIGDKISIFGGHIGRKETVNTVTRLTKKYIVVHFRYKNGYEKDVLFAKSGGRERGGENWLSLFARPLENES